MAEKLQIIIDAKDNASGVVRGVGGTIKTEFSLASVHSKGLSGAVRGYIQEQGGFANAVQANAQQIRSAGMVMAGVGGIALYGAKQMVSAAGQMERYSAQYKVLTGSAEAAEKRLKQVSDFAAKTPFDLPGVIEADKLVQAFNLDLGGLEPTLEAFGDTAAAMGVPMDQVIRGMAKLKAGMFDMAEMAPMGITREELSKLGVQFSATGQVLNKDELFPAAIRLLSKFKGTMSGMSETTEGKLSNLSDSFFQLKASAGESLLPALKLGVEGMTKFIDIAKVVVDTPIGKAFVIAGVGAGVLTTALGLLGVMLPSIIRGYVILTGAQMKNAVAARASAAANMQAASAIGTAGAAAATAAPALAAGGAAAGGAAAVAGGAAAGGAAAKWGVRGALRGAARFIPYAIAAEVGYEGSKYYFGKQQAEAEQQVADIESGATETPEQKALIAANMARWEKAREQQGLATAPAAGFPEATPALAGIPTEQMISDQMLAPELAGMLAPEIAAPRSLAGITALGGGAFALPSARSGGAGRSLPVTINAEGVTVSEEPLPGGGRKLLFEVTIPRDDLPQGILTDNTDAYLEDYGYQGVG